MSFIFSNPSIVACEWVLHITSSIQARKMSIKRNYWGKEEENSRQKEAIASWERSHNSHRKDKDGILKLKKRNLKMTKNKNDSSDVDILDQNLS